MRSEVEEIVARLMLVYRIENNSYTRLCAALGYKKNCVHAWLSRRHVPALVLSAVAKNKNLSLDWLANGEGAMMRGSGTLPRLTLDAPPHKPLLKRTDGQAIEPGTLDTLEMVLNAPPGAQGLIKSVAEQVTDLDKRLRKLEGG